MTDEVTLENDCRKAVAAGYPESPLLPQTPGDDTVSSPWVTRLLWLAFAPSLLTFFRPVLDADVAALAFGKDPSILNLFTISGRPLLGLLLWPFVELVRLLQFPAGAYVFIVFHVAWFGLWLVVSHRLLSRILGSSMVSALLQVILSVHFHAYEMRLIGGGAVYPAILPFCFGMLVVLKLWDSGGSTGRGVAIVALSSLVALNIHQAGAFLAPAVLSLLFCRALLQPGPLDPVAIKRSLWLCAAFGLGCLVYALEMFLIVRFVGFIERPMTLDPIANTLVFLRRLPLWLPALLPLPWLVREGLLVFGALFALILVSGWRAAAGVSIPRRVMAVAAVFAGALATMAPTMATSGSYTSRVLYGFLLAIWGGILLFHSSGNWSAPAARWSRPAILSWIALSAVCHFWGYALNVWIKGDSVAIARAIRSELSKLSGKATPGQPINAYLPQYTVRDIAWSDAGSILVSTGWGLEAILRSESFSDGVALPPVNLHFFVEKLPPPEWTEISGGPFVRADGSVAMINGGAFVQRQIAIVERFRRPWQSDTVLPIGSLIRFCGTQTSDVIQQRWDWPERRIEFSVTTDTVPKRVNVTANAQDSGWTLGARVRFESSHTTGSIHVRFLAVDGDGKETVIASEEVSPNREPILVRGSVPRPGLRPVIEYLPISPRSGSLGQLQLQDGTLSLTRSNTSPGS